MAEILPRFAITDPFLEQLAIAITTFLRDGTPEDSLYMETVAQMMAVHLARQHSTQSRPVQVTTPELSDSKVRDLVAYIEENLAENLTLATLAGQAQLTPLYLARAFKAAVGQPPHQYVLRRRLEKAKDLLRNTDQSVVDVALSVGFCSQSHLAYWLLRDVGVSPAAYRRQGKT